MDLLIGHSLGAVVALQIVALQPDYAAAVVVEDPPGPVGPRELGQVADEVERSVRRARIDREAEVAAVLRDNPSWSPVDAAHAVDGCLDTELAHVTALLRTEPWDLHELVRGCSVPLQLLAATNNSALIEPDRTEVPRLLPHERTAVIPSGHSIHQDRPGLWLHEVLSFARPSGGRRSGSRRTSCADLPVTAGPEPDERHRAGRPTGAGGIIVRAASRWTFPRGIGRAGSLLPVDEDRPRSTDQMLDLR